jgi:hypothetical protein
VTGRDRRGILHGTVRRAGAAVAVAALALLVAVGPPDRAAHAATSGYNQITGIGETNSAVTVSWSSGLLDDTNTPLASDITDPASNADRVAGTGPLSFMYSDFQNLQVTVSQTQDITHQGITVNWTGGEPTVQSGSVQANFLQMMECYGDASTGPDPEDCEFGSAGLLPSGAQNPFIGEREGDLCNAGSVPSTANPPASLDGDPPQYGCDTLEPTVPSHVAPQSSDDYSGGQSFSIPFDPVNGAAPVWGALDTSQYFNEFDTDEVQQSVTNPGGTGQQQFETLTGTEAPGLGCGLPESNGQPRGCWLVIVPRGQYEPNGWKVRGVTGPGAFIDSSPLGASNWAMRIQIHLGFAPVQVFCPIGTQERETVGTQVIARAVQSWQLALNQQANCSKIYGYSAVPEATSTQQLANPSSSGIGLAFTTIPIGSEAARDGDPKTTLPPIVYAPVGVSADAFGFNINEGSGYVSTPIKLTPVLLAKSLTQVYRTDLPDYYPSGTGFPGPAWSQGNPTNLSDDPQFQSLNPEVTPYNLSALPLAPMLTEDHSALNQQVWQWMQTDSTADAWLDNGTTDTANTVTANPDYEALNLGKAPAIDSFPRAYTGCLDLGQWPGPPPKEETKCSLDLLPYSNNFESTAANVLGANNPVAGNWSSFATAPDGSAGWWAKVGPQPVGQIFDWGLSDTPDLAAFGLVDADLCNDAGTSCVGPSTASVTAALDAANPDSTGLLEVNPADPGTGGYPLVQVVYAAVATDQSSAALNDYADLIDYAATSGQTPGVAPGQLPPGYLPLSASLRTQALAAVATLRADAGGTTGTSGSGKTSSSASSGTSTSTATSGLGSTPIPGSSAAEFVVGKPSAVVASATTPAQGVGTVRWVLVVVVIAGTACAISGTVLRSARVQRLLHRVRP